MRTSLLVSAVLLISVAAASEESTTASRTLASLIAEGYEMKHFSLVGGESLVWVQNKTDAYLCLTQKTIMDPKEAPLILGQALCSRVRDK